MDIVDTAVSAGSFNTLNGQSFMVSMNGGSVMADNANIIRTDSIAGNGVIHAINSVILPKDM